MLTSYSIVIISCIRLKFIVSLLQAGPTADFTSTLQILYNKTRLTQ